MSLSTSNFLSPQSHNLNASHQVFDNFPFSKGLSEQQRTDLCKIIFQYCFSEILVNGRKPETWFTTRSKSAASNPWPKIIGKTLDKLSATERQEVEEMEYWEILSKYLAQEFGIRDWSPKDATKVLATAQWLLQKWEGNPQFHGVLRDWLDEYNKLPEKTQEEYRTAWTKEILTKEEAEELQAELCDSSDGDDSAS